MSINFRAIQAAAQAIYEATEAGGKRDEYTWDDETWDVQEPFFRMAQAALHAGAPTILRDVAARLEDEEEKELVLESAEEIEVMSWH